MGGAKLTFSPGDGEIEQGKVPCFRWVSMQIPLRGEGRICPSYNWASLDSVILDFNDTCSLRSWWNLLRKTFKKDQKGTLKMNLAIKQRGEWGNFLVADPTSYE